MRRPNGTPAPFDRPVYVTRPVLPPLASMMRRLEQVWATQQLTNIGQVMEVGVVEHGDLRTAPSSEVYELVVRVVPQVVEARRVGISV